MGSPTGTRPLWNRWFTPYLILWVTPAITLPLSASILDAIPNCIEDEQNYKFWDFELVLLPSLADFLPFLWLLSPNRRVRWSAAIAGVIGALRFAAPQYFVLADVLSENGTTTIGAAEPAGSCDDYPIHLYAAIGIALVMVIAWPASVVLSLIAAALQRVLLRAAPGPRDV